MDIMSTRTKKYHQGKVTIPKAAVSILRLFDKEHNSTPSSYAVSSWKVRWTAREESLCWSFLQTQMPKNPHHTRQQLLRDVSVYLLTEGLFRIPGSIYTHLRYKAGQLGSERKYVSRKTTQGDIVTSTLEALDASPKGRGQAFLPPVVTPAAESLVLQAYQEVNAASNGVHHWYHYRSYAYQLAKFGAFDVDAKDIDMALLCLHFATCSKRYETCGTPRNGAGNCHKCNPVECLSCGRNTSRWRKMCKRCSNEIKRLGGKANNGIDQNRCITCGLVQNNKRSRCPTCVLSMERSIEQKGSSNTEEEDLAHPSRRPEHQLGDRRCIDCKESAPLGRQRCQLCHEQFMKRLRLERAKRVAKGKSCVDCRTKLLPGEAIRCASCLKHHQEKLAARAICSDCGQQARVGRKRCAACESLCVKRRTKDWRDRKRKLKRLPAKEPALCLDCREQLPVPVQNRKRCSACQTKFKKATGRRAMAEKRGKRAAQSYCWDCKVPVQCARQRCDPCAAIYNSHTRERKRRKRAADVQTEPICGNCGGPRKDRHKRCAECTRKHGKCQQKKYHQRRKAAKPPKEKTKPPCSDCGGVWRARSIRCAPCAKTRHDTQIRESRKRNRVAELAAEAAKEKPEALCCDCRGRAAIGRQGRPNKRCEPCELKIRWLRRKQYEKRKREAE